MLYEVITQRKKFTLNYKSLWKICCPDEPYPKNGEYQLTLRQAQLFFVHFSLKLVAMDKFDNVHQVIYNSALQPQDYIQIAQANVGINDA